MLTEASNSSQEIAPKRKLEALLEVAQVRVALGSKAVAAGMGVEQPITRIKHTRAVSRDVLRRNHSLLRLINEQRDLTRREVRKVREFKGILTARALQKEASGSGSGTAVGLQGGSAGN